ncbi:MAG TPA: protein-methionine-sulfoxide reductase heme-binding subunit MsrQ [Magnetospirillaceae bacterium]|jgi:sulfoxide reductase heme-binding subunit YedZ
MAGPRSLPWWKPTIKTGLHALYTLPILALLARGYADYSGTDFLGGLGVNPIETVIRNLGDWSIRFLIVALAVTPVRRISGLPQIARYRRMLGLWAFAYVTIHLLFFIGVDQYFDWHEIWKEILKNKFITVGMLGFVFLLPLALTSTSGMIRRLGAARWRRLHRLVYFAGIAGAIHYIWMVKAITIEPVIYTAIIAILLAMRVFWWAQTRQAIAPQRVASKAG